MSDAPQPTRAATLVAHCDPDGWFEASKTAPMWGRLLADGAVVDTLEGPVVASAGDILCRGVAGELWPQSLDAVAKRYVVTDEVDPQGWRRFDPRPEAARVAACKTDASFTVSGDWGSMHAEAGDYVLKPWAERGLDVPTDAWVVRAAVFEQTYERS